MPILEKNFHNLPTARNKDIVVQELEGETLVYDLKTNKANCLNETSATVWKFCDGKRTISEITNEVSREFRKPILSEIIILSIDQLREANLLLECKELVKLKNSERREMIKTLGFASVIALPLVSSIVAPKAVDAASGGGGAQACSGTCFTQGDDICSGCDITSQVPVLFVFYNSTDGSCSGTVTNQVPANCANPTGTGTDVCRVSNFC